MQHGRIGLLILALLTSVVSGAEMRLQSPSEYQIAQRRTTSMGSIAIRGSSDHVFTRLQARLHILGKRQPWKTIPFNLENGEFHAVFEEAPAGGWYQLDIRLMDDEKEVALESVAKVGIGDIFVVAGQSNSANHGEEKLKTQTGRVATQTSTGWQLCEDPQPEASGGRGSFLPPLGDSLVGTFDVPIGFVACGIGATSVREWLPEGTTFPNPPTIEGRVRQRTDGTWESRGAAYASLVKRMGGLGPRGFRAVLWHQGESDANQRDASRTLPGQLYREYLTRIIEETRRELQWNVPWFVAQVSYHTPDDPGSEDIRAAQAALWKNGTALEGPDSDALTGKLRERDGRGVHFSKEGLRVHAQRWHEKVAPWLTIQLQAAR